MTGDRIVACIAIVGMLALIVPRFVNNPDHRRRLLPMAGLWLLIVVTIVVVVMALT